MKKIAQVSKALQKVFGETALRAGRESRFVRRKVKLDGSSFVKTLVFGWLNNPDASYEELAQFAGLFGVEITAQALEQRFTPSAVDCMRRVLEAACEQVIQADPSRLPLLERFSEVYVQDSTAIQLPDELSEMWPGCGGDAPTRAALKVQVRWAIRCGALDGLYLTPGRANDAASATQSLPVAAGALRLADLGYWSLPRFAELDRQGAYWLSRLKAGIRLWLESDEELDLPRYLSEQTADSFELAVKLGCRQELSCRLLAQRVPSEVSKQRRRKLRRKATKKGRRPSRAQLAMCDWTLIVTNVPRSMLTLEEALSLLSLRWQVELLFKHWKSVGKIDSSRSSKPDRRLCEFYAKLLGQIVEHWALLCGRWDYPARSLTKAARIVRKLALHWACLLPHARLLGQFLRRLGAAVSLGCKINKRRKSPPTFLRLQLAAAPLA